MVAVILLEVLPFAWTAILRALVAPGASDGRVHLAVLLLPSTAVQLQSPPTFSLPKNTSAGRSTEAVSLLAVVCPVFFTVNVTNTGLSFSMVVIAGTVMSSLAGVTGVVVGVGVGL